MQHPPYIGSGPYCYANSFAMMFGEHAPSTAVIELATGSPFGMQMLGGALPLFDPYGWDPDAGFDGALAALGWTSARRYGGHADEALARLREALADGPVWVGPVEMGHLRHQPGMRGPIQADHYIVALAIEDGQVLMHDPQGFPYATLPLADFMTAWAAETIDYGAPYTLRTRFERIAAVSETEAIRAALPAAMRWLSMAPRRPVPAGTLGNADAALALADRLRAGCDEALRMHLIHFAVRVGARRASDTAACLARAGCAQSSRIAAAQARLIGALQYPLVTQRDEIAADGLRRLAPTYEQLLEALRAES